MSQPLPDNKSLNNATRRAKEAREAKIRKIEEINTIHKRFKQLTQRPLGHPVRTPTVTSGTTTTKTLMNNIGDRKRFAQLKKAEQNENQTSKMSSRFLPQYTGYGNDSNLKTSPENLIRAIQRDIALNQRIDLTNPTESIPTRLSKIQGDPLQAEIKNEMREMDMMNITEKAAFIKKLRNKITQNIYNARNRIQNAQKPAHKELVNMMKDLAKKRANAEPNERQLRKIDYKIEKDVRTFLGKHRSNMNYQKESIIYLSIALKEIRELFERFNDFVRAKGYIEDPAIQDRLRYILAQYVLVRDRIQDILEIFEVEEPIKGRNGNSRWFQPHLYIHFLYPLLARYVSEESLNQNMANLFEDNLVTSSPPAGSSRSPQPQPQQKKIEAYQFIRDLMTKMKKDQSKLLTQFNSNINKPAFNGIFKGGLQAKCKIIPYTLGVDCRQSPTTVGAAASSSTVSSINPNEVFKLFYQCIDQAYQSEGSVSGLSAGAGGGQLASTSPVSRPEFVMVNLIFNEDIRDRYLIEKLNRFRTYDFTVGYRHYQVESIYWSIPSRDSRRKFSLTVVTRRLDKYYVYKDGEKRALTPYDMKNMLQFGYPTYILYRVGFSMREIQLNQPMIGHRMNNEPVMPSTPPPPLPPGINLNLINLSESAGVGSAPAHTPAPTPAPTTGHTPAPVPTHTSAPTPAPAPAAHQVLTPAPTPAPAPAHAPESVPGLTPGLTPASAPPPSPTPPQGHIQTLPQQPIQQSKPASDLEPISAGAGGGIHATRPPPAQSQHKHNITYINKILNTTSKLKALSEFSVDYDKIRGNSLQIRQIFSSRNMTLEPITKSLLQLYSVGFKGNRNTSMVTLVDKMVEIMKSISQNSQNNWDVVYMTNQYHIVCKLSDYLRTIVHTLKDDSRFTTAIEKHREYTLHKGGNFYEKQVNSKTYKQYLQEYGYLPPEPSTP
jgi:hypothetical protein